MKKLTVLVDMDDTLENLTHAWVDWLNLTHKTSVRYEDITQWDMKKAFPDIPTDEIYAPLTNRKFWRTVKPLPGAQKYLKKLINLGHSVYIVTASDYRTAAIKLPDVLFRYFPFISMKNVIITSAKQLIKADVLIDDAPHNLEGGSYKKILFGAEHNKKYDAEAHGMTRARNWAEIYDIVNKISEEN